MKATHIGHCQCCGRAQKLPEGLLSQHGYTVASGFFQGVCRGRGELPYERSCGLIEKFVAYAQKELEIVNAEIAKNLAPATEAVGWYREYAPSPMGRGRMSYQWHRVKLVYEDFEFRDGEKTKFLKYIDYEGKQRRLDLYDYTVKTLEAAATKMNAKYVEQHLMPQKKQIEEYIRWQQKRVTDWKLTACIPATEKNCALFKL